MPKTPKNPKLLTFNVWLQSQANPESHPLAKVWITRRGRLTRDSVDKRCQNEYGFEALFGARMWDSYLADRDMIVVNDDGALLDLDPSL